MNKLILKIFILLRNSFLRKPIVKFLLRLHNFSYQWAGFFCLEDGVHPKHRLMNYHKFFVDNISPDDMVLDVGCGNGALTYDLAKKAKKVIGVDINKENIYFAKKKFSRDNIEYICADFRSLHSTPRGNSNITPEFNVITLSNVLEHIKDRAEFLGDLVSKYPKAKFLIRAPMINRDWLVFYKKELGIEWRADKTHYIEYTLESFREELEKAGLKIENHSIQFGETWAVVIKN